MIISSLLDTDFYKLSMFQWLFLNHYELGSILGKTVTTEYAFKCRNKINLAHILPELQKEIESFANLRFIRDELVYLKSLGFFDQTFLEYLRKFKLSAKDVTTTIENGDLSLRIEGPWSQTILWEIPLLAMINELHFRNLPIDPKHKIFNIWEEGQRRLQKKIIAIRQADLGSSFRFSDFGTRRRYSTEWQEYVVCELQKQLPVSCVGTSNVLLSKKLGTTPIGTMAHEYLQAWQALRLECGPAPLEDFQKLAFYRWLKNYQETPFLIALSDVVGMDAFLKDFYHELAAGYLGVRHDSGDPLPWAEKLIAHYKKLKIDPTTKLAIFSDGLTVTTALELAKKLKGRIKTSFGIGTHLTNDVGLEPLQIVIKMVKCNGQPVAKISDSPGKGMCQDAEFLIKLQKAFGIENNI